MKIRKKEDQTMERLNLIENQKLFDNPTFKDEEQEFKKRNELDSLSLAGLSIAASGVNLLVPGILSVTAFLDR